MIVAGALLLFAWGLSKNGYGNPYYAGAVRSMTHSWRDFVFGAADPDRSDLTDKPPLSLWAGALAARVFGFSSWSLLMPSVLAGAASVGLLMATVRRVWGLWAAHRGGGAGPDTDRRSCQPRQQPDATLVLCLVAAAYFSQRAISDQRRRWRWLVLVGLCCGLAFLSKLLVAVFVIPGAVAGYLLAGPAGWRRRCLDVLVARGPCSSSWPAPGSLSSTSRRRRAAPTSRRAPRTPRKASSSDSTASVA